ESRVRRIFDIHRTTGQDAENRRHLPARSQDSQFGAGELRTRCRPGQIENLPAVFGTAISRTNTVAVVVAAVGPINPCLRASGVCSALVWIRDAMRPGIGCADGNTLDRPALRRDDQAAI